jgi:hypothetical protein
VGTGGEGIAKGKGKMTPTKQPMKTSDRDYNLILENWRHLLRIKHPPQMVDELLRITKDQAPSLTKERVEAFFDLVLAQTPRRVTDDTLDVAVNADGSYKGTKTRSLKLAGESVPLRSDSWDDLVVALCSKIASENPVEFKRVLVQITSSRNREYFAEKPGPLTRWRAIGSTGIYVEQNLSANNAVELCKTLAHLFGDEPGIEVETW